jgi:hypothetical protein
VILKSIKPSKRADIKEFDNHGIHFSDALKSILYKYALNLFLLSLRLYVIFGIAEFIFVWL